MTMIVDVGRNRRNWEKSRAFLLRVPALPPAYLVTREALNEKIGMGLFVYSQALDIHGYSSGP
jgi:hypothetical protein